MSDAQYEHLYEARKARNERNVVIEECAKVAESSVPQAYVGPKALTAAIAAAIRALKEKP